MRGYNFLPATASPADSARSILILRGKLELINISIWLFCSTGIISTGRMHLYPALLLHRDYFDLPDASLSCSFIPQGLFPPAGCISVWLFCSTGITSAGQMHLCLAFLLHRDYFARPDASLSGFFALQGLFRPVQLHLYPALLFHRDYFGRSDASLSGFFVPQGLFRPARCISIWFFFTSGIISAGQIEALLEFLISFQLLHFYFSLLDVELPFSVCQEKPFWHH